jgi:hypothetical protein
MLEMLGAQGGVFGLLVRQPLLQFADPMPVLVVERFIIGDPLADSVKTIDQVLMGIAQGRMFARHQRSFIPRRLQRQFESGDRLIVAHQLRFEASNFVVAGGRSTLLDLQQTIDSFLGGRDVAKFGLRRSQRRL